MKKLLWSGLFMVMLVTLSLLSGCSKGPDTPREPESSGTLVVVDPDMSSDEASILPESSDTGSSEEDGQSSETDLSVSGDSSGSTSKATDTRFTDAFDSNPIDAAFTSEINGASTSKEMQTVINKFAEIWETEVMIADKKAKQALKGNTLSQYNNGQQQWENNKEAALEQIKENIQNEFGGSTAALEMSQQTLSFYRSRVREIYRTIFDESGTLPDLQYETAVG